MYSLRNIFKQEPNAVAGVVAAIVNIAIAFGVGVSVEQLAAINSALVLVLAMFYVRPLTASKDALRELASNGSSSKKKGKG